jgi:hypothetical protein
MSMTRKQFLETVGKVAAGAAGLALVSAAGCGDDDGGDGTVTPDADTGGAPDADPNAPDASPPSCLDNGTTVTISANHGHTLTVSKADVTAGVDKTYDITGGALHSHSVTVTGAQFAMLAANTTVMVTSTVAGHTHSVTIACA